MKQTLIFLVTVGALLAVQIDRAQATTPAAMLCAGLFNSDSPTEAIAKRSLVRGYAGSIDAYLETLKELNVTLEKNGVDPRETGSQIARWVSTAAHGDGNSLIRLMFFAITKSELPYSKDWYDGFLSEMYRASLEFESRMMTRATTKQFFDQVLQDAFHSALEQEAVAAKSGEFRPVHFYANLVWLPDSRYSPVEAKLRHYWKEQIAQPFAESKAAEKAGRKLAALVFLKSQGDVKAYLRFNSLVLSQFRMNYAKDFYRGFLDENFAQNYARLDANTQNLLKQFFSRAEKNNGFILTPPATPELTLSELLQQSISSQSGFEVIALYIRELSKRSHKNAESDSTRLTIEDEEKIEFENDLAQADIGLRLGTIIRDGSGGSTVKFLKLFAFSIVDTPYALHPIARDAFQRRMLATALELRLPATQIEALRHLLRENHMDAVEHLKELGWLDEKVDDL